MERSVEITSMVDMIITQMVIEIIMAVEMIMNKEKTLEKVMVAVTIIIIKARTMEIIVQMSLELVLLERSWVSMVK